MDLKETIGTLADTPDILKIYINNLSEAELHFQPAGKNFSVLETICHLRDIEIEAYRVRLERLLAEKKPRLPDLDGSRLAVERHYRRQELLPAFTDFIRARYTNLRKLENLTNTQLARTGFLKPYGKITLGRLLELWVDHDQVHIHELETLRSAARKPSSYLHQELNSSTGI